MDFSHILTDSYTIMLAAVLVVSFIILCLYYGLFFFRVGHFRRKKKADDEGQHPPVSVVLVAQNDGEWLRTNLVYLLEQNYPEFEVVVVDYLSNDDTSYILQMLSDYYKRLKVVTFRENASGYEGKKYPFSIGIKSAKHDILLLADPKCMPRDLEKLCWIREMVAGYDKKNTDIVLGYCAIRAKNSLCNWFQQYDNLDYSTEYLGAALLHHPFTGNGRNLSYRRSMFLDHGGFIYHYYIPDGADDMFVNQNADRHNTNVVLSEGAFTMVEPQPSFHEWHLYRKHRTATHGFYGFGLKLTRLMRPLSVVLFYLAGVLLLLRGTIPWEILAGVLALKLAWQIISTAQATRRLLVKPVVYWLSPIFEIYFLLANTILSIFPLRNKNA